MYNTAFSEELKQAKPRGGHDRGARTCSGRGRIGACTEGTGLQPKDSPECQTFAESNRKRFSEMVKTALLFSFVN